MRTLIVILVALGLIGNKVRGFNLQCKFVSKTYDRNWSVNSCIAENFTITEPNQIVTSINNNQNASHFQNQNVKAIEILSVIVNFFPKELEKFFPNLEGIIIGGTNLKSVDKSDLMPFERLKHLELFNNDLESLDSDLFEHNPEMQYISFNGNTKLQSIGGFILDKLAKLEVVLFSRCGCISGNAGQLDLPFFVAELKEKCAPEFKEAGETIVYPPTTEEQPYFIWTSYPPYIPTSTPAMQTYDELLSEIQELRSQLSLMQEKYDLDVDNLNKTIRELQAKPVDDKSSSKELSSQLNTLKAKQQTCDGNLDAVLSNLLANRQGNIFNSGENPTIDLSCRIDNKDQCTVIDLKLKFSDSTIAMVKDKNGKAIVSADVKSLNILGQQTLFLPTNLAQIFPLLKALTVTDSGLFEIDSASLRGLENLASLILKNNKLMKIAADAFRDLKNLVKLDLSFNKMLALPDAVFGGLVKLQDLILNDNLLNGIGTKALEGLLNLTNLQLQNNKLKAISPSLFQLLALLATADFTNNVCINVAYPKQTKANVEKIIIDQCIAPVELNCQFSHEVIQLDDRTNVDGYKCHVQNLTVESLRTKISNITSMTHPSQRDIPSVIGFVARNQDIKFIPLNIAGSLANLQKLIIESSKLNSIQRTDLRNLTGLQLISFAHNNVSSIGEGAFDDVIKLEYLSLDDNQIASLPSKIFAQLAQLKTLLLSNNRLIQLSADIIPRKNAILILRANNNTLTMIQTKIFRSLRKANVIDFTTNECINMMFSSFTQYEGITLPQLLAEVDFNCSWDESCK